MSPSQAILCRQCSAPLPVEQGAPLVVCDFCETTNAVDASRVVLQYAVRQTLRDEDALAALRRWMAGNETVKNLDQKATIARTTFQHFPMWLVRAQVDGQEKVFLEPAAATAIGDVKALTIPAADLEPFEPFEEEGAVLPTVPHDAMRGWLARDYQVQEAQIRETALVFLPLYVCKYDFQGTRFTALVDAASGQVFATLFPTKWELPYRTLGIASFAINFILAFIPLAGYLIGGGGGFFAGLGIYLLAVVVAAVPIFVTAATISARV